MFDSIGSGLLFCFFGFFISFSAPFVIEKGVSFIDYLLEEYIEWIKPFSKHIVGKAIVLVSFLGVVFVFAIFLPIILSTLSSISDLLKEFKLDDLSNSKSAKLFYFYCCFVFAGVVIVMKWYSYKNDQDH